ncbi:MAG: TldD/PmbA family protein [Alphaproteobacteria bacterium]|nr:TldD/PmbA family protein [Alphaproteobacteria bacterium]
MTDAKKAETLELLEGLLKQAKGFGASSADAVLSDSSSVSVTRRFGKPETLSRAEEAEIGLRVFVDKKSAIVSSSDRSPEALKQMAERAVSMAKAVPEDGFSGIAEAEELAKDWPDLDLFDGTELPVEKMADLADEAEQAALEVKGVTNSEGAECGSARDMVYYVSSNGFAGGYASSGFSLSVSVIAGTAAMETDYDFDAAAFFADLMNPAEIGRSAGERAVRALNPKKGGTKIMPVVYDRRVSGSLVGALAQAVSGSAVARGTTMLKDKMDQQVFAKGLTVVDDPFLKRGRRSHPFDAEGISPQKRNIIDDGVLTGWLLDLRAARQLGLKSTGNAGRGASSPPSPRPANFFLQPGAQSLDALIADIDEGFYVTQMMGHGANTLTGDYSRGARGFWIEKGKITYPVSEMTVAGNLKDMWMNMTPANDLGRLRYGIDAPSLRVEGITVAGG